MRVAPEPATLRPVFNHGTYLAQRRLPHRPQGSLWALRNSSFARFLTVVLVAVLVHLMDSQARPTGAGLAGLHARGACCCAKDSHMPQATKASAGLSAPEEESCCAGPGTDPVVTAPASSSTTGCQAKATPEKSTTQVEDEDSACCSNAGGSCSCHHIGSAVAGIQVPNPGMGLPQGMEVAMPNLREELCQRPVAPPEQPPRS